MKQNVKEHLEKLAKGDFASLEQVVDATRKLLDEELKEEIISLFEDRLTSSYSDKELGKAIMKQDKVGFIYHCYYYSSLNKFLKENFDKLDVIMKTLKEYLETQAKEENNND